MTPADLAGSGSPRARATLAFLRQRISSGEWPVNRRIPTESELMDLLGVGKTTVREAVRSLASIGMLETLPGRGTFVRSRTPVSSVLTDFLSDFAVGDVLTYRRALEVEAAQRAAVMRTDDQLAALRAALHHVPDERDVDYLPRIARGRTPGQFHFLVVEAGANPLISTLYAGVMAVLRDAVSRGEVGYGEDEAVRRRDHEELFAAIEARDAAAAAHAAGRHADRDLVPAVAGAPRGPGAAPREADTAASQDAVAVDA